MRVTIRTGPASLIFYFDFIYGLTKGGITAGSKVVGSATTPGPFSSTYTSETVDGESVAGGVVTTNTAIAGSLTFVPIRAGSVMFSDGNLTVTDDGSGNLVGDIGSGGTKTINYQTGAFSFSFNAASDVAGTTATYDYDSENADATKIPELDILLTNSPVTARPRKLRARWSLEASNNLRALYGLDAEVELVTAIAEQIGNLN